MAEEKAGQDDAQQDVEQQDDVEVEGAQTDEKVEKPQASKTYTQEEVDRILGKVRKNARYLGRKEAESELLRQGVSPRQAAAAVEKPAEDLEPKREDFEDYEKYLDARAEWKGRKGQREESAKQRREEEARAEQKRETDAAREFKKRADAVIKEVPDFAEVIENADDVKITETMGREIKDSPHGPRILYELAKDPDEALRISELTEKAQVREILKIESRLEAAAAGRKAKDDAKDEDADDSKDEEGADDQLDAQDDAEDKGEDQERRRDGTFKSAKKRTAPEPIEPGTARSATGSSRLPSDKDDIKTWNKKMDELEARERGR